MSLETLPALSVLQERFRAAVLGEGDAPMAAFVQKPSRLGVYRNTVQASLIDVLATAFPVVRRIVGEDFFTGLAARFINSAPPRVPQLSLYGDGFAGFISGADIGERLPYLADVARLEWARAESYFAADAPPLDMARIAALSPEDLEHLVLPVHPATRLIGSRYPIHRIWEVNQPSVADVPAVDMSIAQWVLVSRNGHHLITRALAKHDAAFIAEVMRGQTLGEAVAGIDAAFDLQAALQDHFINGTFSNA